MALRHFLSAALVGALTTLSLPAIAGEPKIFPLENGVIPTAPLMPFANGKLVYFGGHVIANVNIVAVSWGSSVDSTYMTNMEGFYKTVTKSPWIDWMTEYDTIGLVGYVDGKPGSNQHIGRGGYWGAVVLTLQNKSTSLSDADIGTELTYQIMSGALPPPQLDAKGSPNTLYMIDFPSGITISLGSSYKSCSNFGAYHSSFAYKNRNVPYGVHPYCGYGFDTSTIIHSHELAEAITDAEVGGVVSSMSARPLAWLTADSAGYEAGDLCTGTSALVSGYYVQKIWSNYAGGCVAEIPICDGSLSPPACRPCNPFDDGVSCSGSTSACAAMGTKQGRCVPCTSADPSSCVETTLAVCDDSTYTCVGCLTNKDCGGASPVCETSSKTCRPCAVDGECATGTVCDTSRDDAKGHCVQCTSDAQCTRGTKCDGASHACVTPPEVPDAGDPPDSSTPTQAAPTADSGCGCEVTGRSNETKGAALALVAMAFVFRRRRKS